MFALTHDPINYHALTESVRRPGCGAVCLFLGTVRDLTGDDETAFLEYTAYAVMAEAKLGQIVEEAVGRWPGGAVAVVHRLGRLAVGDISVAVAASTPHRQEAFAACRHVIDTLKRVVPIWKKDFRPDGAAGWSEPK